MNLNDKKLHDMWMQTPAELLVKCTGWDFALFFKFENFKYIASVKIVLWCIGFGELGYILSGGRHYPQNY